MPNHLRGEAKKDQREESGSSSFVPLEPELDMQLQYALKVVRGEQIAKNARDVPRWRPPGLNIGDANSRVAPRSRSGDVLLPAAARDGY